MFTSQKFFRLIVAGLILGAATSALAADRTIEISGTYAKEVFYPESFGSSDATLPLSVSIVVDDSLVQELPAGTVWHSSGLTFVNSMTLVPPNAVKSLSATLGSVSWDASDIQVKSLPATGQSFAFLVEGGLNSGNGLVAITLTDNFLGLLDLSSVACSGTNCSLSNMGTAVDNATSTDGSISALAVSISPAALTPVQKIADLQEDVEALGLNTAILEAVSAKLEAKNGNKDAAEKQLNAFINTVNAQRGKSLTDAQADDLIARASAVF